jgi:uroporphyrinogen decarboxylase
MYNDERAWTVLMDRLTAVTIDYLRAQVSAGARALQLFDSWVGALSPDDYRRFAMPWSRRVLTAVIDSGVPVIHFGVGTATLLDLMSQAGGDVLGLDWRIPLGEGWRRAGTPAVQGNLDPVALFASRDELARKVRGVLAEAGGRPGHIFNVGHGILPATPPDAIAAVVDLVHEITS